MTAKELQERQQFILLSIKPKYAEAICSGKKTVELRKKFIKGNSSKDVFLMLYATAPVKKVVGIARVSTIVTMAADTTEKKQEIWEIVKDKACIEEKDFFKYVDTAKSLSLIYIAWAENLTKEVDVCEMHEGKAPQNYCFLKDMYYASPAEAFQIYVEKTSNK